MSDMKLTAWICTALMRVGTRMATGFDQHFARFGLTQAQFRILLAVWERGGADGIAPSTLADYLLIERGTVSVLTNRVVERGWLTRKPGENRRTFRLALTKLGKQVVDEVAPHAIALADRTLAGISQEQLQEIRANLEIIEANLRNAETINSKEEQ